VPRPSSGAATHAAQPLSPLSLPPAQERNRFTKDGVLVVTSTRHRTQAQNVEDALEKLQEMLDAAAVAVTPKEIDPEAAKRVKKAVDAGRERRLQDKKKEGSRKQERSRRDWD
jgi:peptidyl-tRNA hydrolase ICT1